MYAAELQLPRAATAPASAGERVWTQQRPARPAASEGSCWHPHSAGSSPRARSEVLHLSARSLEEEMPSTPRTARCPSGSKGTGSLQPTPPPPRPATSEASLHRRFRRPAPSWSGAESPQTERASAPLRPRPPALPPPSEGVRGQPAGGKKRGLSKESRDTRTLREGLCRVFRDAAEAFVFMDVTKTRAVTQGHMKSRLLVLGLEADAHGVEIDVENIFRDAGVHGDMNFEEFCRLFSWESEEPATVEEPSSDTWLRKGEPPEENQASIMLERAEASRDAICFKGNQAGRNVARERKENRRAVATSLRCVQ
jgi:hypothetical protein